jgi:uncharacterized membrane protein YkgB
MRINMRTAIVLAIRSSHACVFQCRRTARAIRTRRCLCVFGALKFASYEAQGIQPLVANSPLMSWLYDVFSINTFSALLRIVELFTAALLAVKPWWPKVSAIGSAMATGLFVATISFLFTTPGVTEASAGGCSARAFGVDACRRG